MRPFAYGTRTGSVFLFMLLFKSDSVGVLAYAGRLLLFTKAELAVSVSIFLHNCIIILSKIQ